MVTEKGDKEIRWHKPAQLPITLLGEDIWACPRQHIRENPFYWAAILKYYGMYRKGFLPSAGGIADQSNKAIEVFRILDDANDACDREELNREKERKARESRMPPRRR